MSDRSEVDHYGSQYGNFASRLYSRVRKATFDEDIGQNGWLTVGEHDLFVDWLDLRDGDRLLDIACGSGGPTLRMSWLTVQVESRGDFCLRISPADEEVHAAAS